MNKETEQVLLELKKRFQADVDLYKSYYQQEKDDKTRHAYMGTCWEACKAVNEIAHLLETGEFI